MPAVNVVIQLVYIGLPGIPLRYEELESYIVFCFVLYLMRILEFFVTIRRTVLLDAKIYLANSSVISGDLGELKKQLYDADKRSKDDASALVEL